MNSGSGLGSEHPSDHLQNNNGAQGGCNDENSEPRDTLTRDDIDNPVIQMREHCLSKQSEPSLPTKRAHYGSVGLDMNINSVIWRQH